MRILITGCAGFIGFHLTSKLSLKKKIIILGVDNINSYYDQKLKKDRLKILKKNKNFFFYKVDISNQKKMNDLFKKNKISYVINLAAQAGVRYSIKNPDEYFKTNILGFYNIIQLCNKFKIKHLIYASTSSVYGSQNTFPISENYRTDYPLSLYAATKKCNEVIAYSYSNIHKLPSTGLRFFTVYGPYGRPDMSLFKFTKAIIDNKKIELFNKGNHIRDFTYVDDVVSYIVKLINKPPKEKIPFKIYNIGNGKPKKLLVFLNEIENQLGKVSKKKLLPLQKGDVYKTHADIEKIKNKTNKHFSTPTKDGISKFVSWFISYYNVKI